MKKRYNKREQMLRYIVALQEIQRNYLKHGKFWHLSDSTEKQGIGTIPKDCLFDLVDQTEITEDYVKKVMLRKVVHQRDYRIAHASMPERAQTLFGSVDPSQAENSTETDCNRNIDAVLTEEVCINFLKDKGYQIYKRYC